MSPRSIYARKVFARIAAFRNYVLLLLVSVAASSLQVSAQSPGSISGKITDAKTGEGLPSVNVLVKGTYYGASSDIDGKFIIAKVNPGTYDISITLLGYKAVEYTGVKVEAGKPTALNVKLEETELTLGKEVVIVGEKPLFDIEQTSSSRTVSSEDIKVTAVQSVQDLVGLQTGVVQSDNQIHIRGSRGYENAYLVDGVPVQDILGGTGFGLQLSPDAIQEMEVITGGYSANTARRLRGSSVSRRKRVRRHTTAAFYKDRPDMGEFARKLQHGYCEHDARRACAFCRCVAPRRPELFRLVQWKYF